MSEWKELKTLQEVAAAQAAGDEIQVYDASQDDWMVWRIDKGDFWAPRRQYRSRLAKKPTQKVEMLAWFNGVDLFWRSAKSSQSPYCKRVPSEDKVIEVEIQ